MRNKTLRPTKADKNAFPRLTNALEHLRQYGPVKTAFRLALSAVNRIAEVRILRAVCVEAPPSGFECPPSYSVCLLTEAQLREYSLDPSYELSPGFLDSALAKGDQCFAVLDGPRLAAYGWYALNPTLIGMQDLRIHVHANYVYMYKGFAHPAYRGQRLHAVCMTAALRHFLSSGYGGLVSYVEADNFASLRSCFRMGYFVFGTVWIARMSGRYRRHVSDGCARYGLDVSSLGTATT